MHAVYVLISLIALISSTIAFDLQLYGINYNSRQGPDWDPKKCKTQAQINADLNILSQNTKRIRIYSLSDCNQAKMVLIAAKKYNLQVWLGIWVSDDAAAFQTEKDILSSLATAGLLDSTVLGIHVGSEAVYRKDVTADKVMNLL